MFSEPDHQFMSRALALAGQGLFGTTPNPRVGCVIVKDHVVVGEGWHRRAGEAHAEVLALAQAADRARGATVYVSLEPCSHHGRTPPCVDALLGARVGRVIAAMEDPNPLVSGRGLAALRAGGVDVRCGLLEQEALELNIGFVARMRTGRPWVRMKVAASLDGMSALRDGSSQWITGAPARGDGHRWRARACAILTGIGTVRDDDPRLTVRDVATDRQPLKVLVDSRLEVSLDARLFGTGRTLVVAAVNDTGRIAALQARGAEVLVLPNAAGKVDLPGLMAHLAGLGINELHVEAGGKLNGSLIREGCVDEMLLYLAPALLGDAQRFAEIMQVPGLEQRHQLTFTGAEMFGDDLRLLARFAGRPARTKTEPAAVVALVGARAE